MAIGKPNEHVIEVTINEDGSVSGDVIAGPGGEGCVNELEKILGDVGPTKELKKKDAFYQKKVGGIKQTTGRS